MSDEECSPYDLVFRILGLEKKQFTRLDYPEIAGATWSPKVHFNGISCTQKPEPISIRDTNVEFHGCSEAIGLDDPWMPSRQVSRKALTCSGSRVMWSALPSFTSRLVVDHWKLLLNLMP